MIPAKDAGMRRIPKTVYVKYFKLLKRSDIPAGLVQEHLPWLGFCLGFHVKHAIAHEKSERLRLFPGEFKLLLKGIGVDGRLVGLVGDPTKMARGVKRAAQTKNPSTRDGVLGFTRVWRANTHEFDNWEATIILERF